VGPGGRLCTRAHIAAGELQRLRPQRAPGSPRRERCPPAATCHARDATRNALGDDRGCGAPGGRGRPPGPAAAHGGARPPCANGGQARRGCARRGPKASGAAESHTELCGRVGPRGPGARARRPGRSDCTARLSVRPCMARRRPTGRCLRRPARPRGPGAEPGRMRPEGGRAAGRLDPGARGVWLRIEQLRTGALQWSGFWSWWAVRRCCSRPWRTVTRACFCSHNRNRKQNLEPASGSAEWPPGRCKAPGRGGRRRAAAQGSSILVQLPALRGTRWAPWSST
jgi:hypothetical protein